jgi:hypothetical protein
LCLGRLGRPGQGFEATLGPLGGPGQEWPDRVAGQLELELQRQQGAGHAQVAAAGGGSEVGLSLRVHGKAPHSTGSIGVPLDVLVIAPAGIEIKAGLTNNALYEFNNFHLPSP